jgi:hypothetical protein
MTSENSRELTEEEQILFDRRSAKLSKYMSLAVQSREDMKTAIDNAFDAGSEFGYELGAMAREDEILSLLDDMFHNLTSSEEDAKLTIEIVRQMILRLDSKNDERRL